MVDDPIGLCAAGEAAWLAAAYSGLGSTWRQESEVAWGPTGSPHPFLLAAVTLAASPTLPEPLLTGRLGVIRDSWACLTEADLPGWTSFPADPWMARPPGRCDAAAVAGVRVEHTVDALLFEDTAFRAAGGSSPSRPGELHPAGSHTVNGLRMLLAWRSDRPVGTGLVVSHARGVVVTAVTVLEAERGRGIGAMLTAAAVNLHPDQPATLTASRPGLGVYRRLGFRQLAAPVHWQLDS